MKYKTLTLLICYSCLCSFVAAQTLWNGITDDDWSNLGNWSSGVPTSATLAQFDGTDGGGTLSIGSSSTVQALGLNFSSGESSNRIIGNSFNNSLIELGLSGITNSNSGGQIRIDSAIQLVGGNQTWTNTGNSLRTRTVNLNGNDLGITTSNTHNFYGAFSDSSAASSVNLTLGGGGTFTTRGGGFSYQGGLIIDGSILSFDSNGSQSTVASSIDVTLQNNATLRQFRDNVTGTIGGTLFFRGDNTVRVDKDEDFGVGSLDGQDSSINVLSFSDPTTDGDGFLLVRDNGELRLEVDAGLNLSDRIQFNVSGDRGMFEFGANTHVDIAVLNGTPTAGQQFTIIEDASSITGTPTTSSEWVYSTIADGDGFDAILTYAVPEPSTLTMLLLSSVVGFVLFRRRR